tara:strand:- start:1158 stop:1775 length:618 start_codon:yes stop_codon:yes gene_type:complete
MSFQIYDSSGRLKTNSVQTVDSGLLGHPGFREDQTTDGFYLGVGHSGTDAGVAHSNFIIYQPWFFPYNVTIKAITISGDDAGNTGVLRVGMYRNSNGLPTTLITASSTDLTGNGTGDTEVSTSFKLDAGWFWMASVEASGDIDIEMTYNNNDATGANLMSQAAQYYNSDWGTYHESGSDLPTTATAASRAQSSYTPRIGLRIESR